MDPRQGPGSPLLLLPPASGQATPLDLRALTTASRLCAPPAAAAAAAAAGALLIVGRRRSYAPILVLTNDQACAGHARVVSCLQ